jgi:hypothetical protein
MPADGATVIIWLVAVAVNLYQTSSSAVPTQPVIVCVAPMDVPLVGLLQLAVTVKLVAAEQPSDCENTLMLTKTNKNNKV